MILPFCFQSLALDPRSPSGIPRTPILVEDTSGEKVAKDADGASADTPTSKVAPSRGAHANLKKKALMAASRLNFADNEEEKALQAKIAAKKAKDPNYTLEEGEIVESEDEENAENVEKKSVKPALLTSNSAVTIKPNESQHLLIENEAEIEVENKAGKKKVNSSSRLVLGEIRDEGNVVINSEAAVKASSAVVEAQDDTLVI